MSHQIAFITGGAKRLGRSLALRLAREGVDIALHYHTSEEAARGVQHEIESLGRRCTLYPFDLTQIDGVETWFAGVLEDLGRLDVLIHSASVFKNDTLATLSFDEYMANWAIHAHAPLLMAKAYQRFQESQKRTGSVISIVDARVGVYDTARLSYSLSKKALREATFMLAKVLAPSIRVNGVAPGPILPPPGETDAYLAAVGKQVPLERPGGPSDIEETVLFLMRHPYITGEIIHVDGGQHLA